MIGKPSGEILETAHASPELKQSILTVSDHQISTNSPFIAVPQNNFDELLKREKVLTKTLT